MRIKDLGQEFYFVNDIKSRIEQIGTSEVTRQNSPTVMQIVTVYMNYLKTIALNEASKLYGSSFDASLVQWIFGVAPYWTHEHKSVVRQACFECGMIEIPSCDTLVLCVEPEAALMSMRERGELVLKVGDKVTVCDSGGTRTVLTTFKVVPGPSYCMLGKPKILGVGSEKIDKELFKRFKHRIGSEVFDEWIKQLPQLASRIFTQLRVMKLFFTSKKLTEQSKKIRILQNDVVLFTTDEALEIFNSTIEEISNGISKHLEPYLNTPMDIVVLGGFARSQHFIKHLTEKFDGLITVPSHPSKTLLDGLSTLGTKPNAIRDRVSRFSYGTQFSKLFDAKVDDPDAYRWGQPPTQFIAAFLPFTTAGKAIPPDRVFEQVVCPANDHQTEFPFGLYYSMETNPKLSDCLELITLTVAIPEAYRSLGRENRFRILMTFGRTEIMFRVVHSQSSEAHESIVVL